LAIIPKKPILKVSIIQMLRCDTELEFFAFESSTFDVFEQLQDNSLLDSEKICITQQIELVVCDVQAVEHFVSDEGAIKDVADSKAHHLHKHKTLKSQPIRSSGNCRPRALLTEEQAIQIYKFRPGSTNDAEIDRSLVGKSGDVAKKFGISPKAVRDIWNRRSWAYETRHLWATSEQPFFMRAQSKSAPPPSKPAQPVAAHSCFHETEAASRPMAWHGDGGVSKVERPLLSSGILVLHWHVEWPQQVASSVCAYVLYCIVSYVCMYCVQV
jgi:hypothetical protein